MAACTNSPALLPSRESQVVAATNPSRDRESSPSRTVFDLLYDRYLPFRLYAEFMLGRSAADLGSTFEPTRALGERTHRSYAFVHRKAGSVESSGSYGRTSWLARQCFRSSAAWRL